MMTSICLFEDEKSEYFHPLTLTRPVYELRCGCDTILEKICRLFPDHGLSLFCADYLADKMSSRYPQAKINTLAGEWILFINGRLIPDDRLVRLISQIHEPLLIESGGETAAVVCKKDDFDKMGISPGKMIPSSRWDILHHCEEDFSLLEYPWHIFDYTSSQISRDIEYRKVPAGVKKTPAGVHLLFPENIHIAEGAVIKPGAVLDAEKGPVFLDRGATVQSNSVIRGPAYIGQHTVVKSGSVLNGPLTIGPVCKIGGEVEECMIQGYSNKQHSGFLGHALLGEWINLGANTTNSDLKNNYAPVSLRIKGERINTGRTFFGLIMGDHSKTAINTRLNTGSVIGVSCNLLSSGFPPSYIPSFSWVTDSAQSTYKLDKALETATRVMARREIEVSEDYLNMMRQIFLATEPERTSGGIT